MVPIYLELIEGVQIQMRADFTVYDLGFSAPYKRQYNNVKYGEALNDSLISIICKPVSYECLLLILCDKVGKFGKDVR